MALHIGASLEKKMKALNMAIEAYAKHAMLTTDEVKARIAAGDARIVNTFAAIRVRFQPA